MAKRSSPKGRAHSARQRQKATPARQVEQRSGIERRIIERRGRIEAVIAAAFANGEPDHADLNLERRQFVFAYLRQLPPADLWLWIDGLWLGNATEAQLVALVTCVTETEAIRQRTGRVGPRPVGRPKRDRLLPAVEPIYNASLRYEWREVTDQLTTLSDARDQFHARMNRDRSGRPRSTDLRDAALRTPIGQRLDQVELFAAFFDSKASTPQEMAAQVLRAELARRLADAETNCRNKAANHLSDQSRAWYRAKAEEAASRRKKLPAWRTLYDNLRRKRD